MEKIIKLISEFSLLGITGGLYIDKDTATGGAILLVVGFVIFFIGYSIMQDPHWRFGQLFSTEVEEQYTIAWIAALGGGAMAVGGLALLIYGVSQQPPSQVDLRDIIPSHTRKKDHSLPSYRMVEVVCPHCKTSHLLKENAEFCPNCGKALPASLAGS